VKRISAVVVVAGVLVSCKLATVRPLPSSGAKDETNAPRGAGGAAAFDAPAYVESVWVSRVLPTVEREAADCAGLVASLRVDRDGTLRRQGRGPRGPAYFLVKGEGTVVSVDRSSRVGLAGLDLGAADGRAEVWLQVGPVIQGMALRDSVGFIRFDQFLNQVEYAEAGNALNQRVLDAVLGGFGAEPAKGEVVSFAGALTPGERLVITPVRLARPRG
jgi:predicted lipoprotein